jgi:hypothetical protein
MGTPWCCCDAVFRYLSVRSNQLFLPLHSCFCRNFNRGPDRAESVTFERPLEKFFTHFSTALWNKHFLPCSGNISLWISFALRHFAYKKHNRTLHFGNILLKNRRNFDYWNQLLNMRLRVWYLDCYQARLFCYIVIRAENLLHHLQQFNLHLWLVYLLSLVLLLLLCKLPSVIFQNMVITRSFIDIKFELITILFFTRNLDGAVIVVSFSFGKCTARIQQGYALFWVKFPSPSRRMPVQYLK